MGLYPNYIQISSFFPTWVACVSIPLCSCCPLFQYLSPSGWDELWTGLLGGRGLSKSNAQWNRVPGGSAVSVRPPPGPLLLCDENLLWLHEEHPRRLSPRLETRCSHHQLLRLGYLKVGPVRHYFLKTFNFEVYIIKWDQRIPPSCKPHLTLFLSDDIVEQTLGLVTCV